MYLLLKRTVGNFPEYWKIVSATFQPSEKKMSATFQPSERKEVGHFPTQRKKNVGQIATLRNGVGHFPPLQFLANFQPVVSDNLRFTVYLSLRSEENLQEWDDQGSSLVGSEIDFAPFNRVLGLEYLLELNNIEMFSPCVI